MKLRIKQKDEYKELEIEDSGDSINITIDNLCILRLYKDMSLAHLFPSNTREAGFKAVNRNDTCSH